MNIDSVQHIELLFAPVHAPDSIGSLPEVIADVFQVPSIYRYKEHHHMTYINTPT